MLTGAILWVNWSTIWKTFVIYCVIGVFHVLFRKRFLLISMQPQEAERQGVAVRWWDFLFYMSFGFVITSSVAIAGVLLVFSFLIVPSVIGMLCSERIGTRLAIGWFSGTVVSLVGLYLSYAFDFPSGPSIVCSFGAILILAGTAQYIIRAEYPGRAVARVGAGTALVLLLLVLSTSFSPPPSNHEASEQSRLASVLEALGDLAEPEGSPQDALRLLSENQDLLGQGLESGQIAVQQETVRRLGSLGSSEAVPILYLVCDNSVDPWMHFYASVALLELGEKEGIHRLIQLLKDSAPPFLKTKVRDTLRAVAGEDFGFDPRKSSEEIARAINRWEVWWHEHADRMVWNTESSSFDVAP